MACITLPTAALIAGGVGAAGSVASSVIGAQAAGSAAKKQVAEEQAALTQQQAATTTAQNEIQPFVTAGSSAIPGLQALEGITGSTGGVPNTAGITNALSTLPGYQFTLNQGLEAAQSGFASQGLARSGPAIKGAAKYAEGLAGTTYQSQLQDYLNTVQLGSGAASSFAGTTMSGTAQANQLLTGIGQTQAAGTVGSANAITGGIGGLTSGLGNSALILGLNNAGLSGNTNSPNSSLPYVAVTPQNNQLGVTQ